MDLFHSSNQILNSFILMPISLSKYKGITNTLPFMKVVDSQRQERVNRGKHFMNFHFKKNKFVLSSYILEAIYFSNNDLTQTT